jgi:small-conductance mechanosensitive channel
MAIDGLLSNEYLAKSVSSLVLLLLLLGLRLLIIRSLDHHVTSMELRRAWSHKIRSFVVVGLIIGLGFIWADALKTFAISILAVAVAFVIATKELIQSLLGAMLRTATRPYSLGDRIEIGNVRGDVVDLNLFTTTLLEVGPVSYSHQHTGRTIIIPNSKFLDTTLTNESFMKPYVIHLFTVPLKADQDWEQAERILREAAIEETASYVEEASQYLSRLQERYDLDTRTEVPWISMHLPEPGRVNLLVRIPCPVGFQGRVQQGILRRFIEKFDLSKGKLRQTNHTAPEGSPEKNCEDLR